MITPACDSGCADLDVKGVACHYYDLKKREQDILDNPDPHRQPRGIQTLAEFVSQLLWNSKITEQHRLLFEDLCTLDPYCAVDDLTVVDRCFQDDLSV
eukprot:scaffold237011_cov29-Tisochrysis_lutea.AAC.1